MRTRVDQRRMASGERRLATASRGAVARESHRERRSGVGGRLLAALALLLGAAVAHGATGERPAITLETLAAPGGAAAGPTVRVALSPEIAPSWREANVGLLALRGDDGQRRLDASAPGAELEVSVPASGCALLVGDLGRPEDRGRADSWRRSRRSVKAVLCDADTDLLSRRRLGALLMARAGTRDEVRLLANPATARAGSDLPLRLYADGRKAAGVELVAEGPGGLRSVTSSDREGFVVLALPAAGPWRVHFRAGADRVAELHFTVPEAALHEAARATRRSFAVGAPGGVGAGGPGPAAAAAGGDAGTATAEAAASQPWEPLGPAPIVAGEFAGFTGRIADLALSRHNPDLYFAAAASGGVWRSPDGGASWGPLTDHLPTTALGAIALDPRDESLVYAGSGEANYAYHSLYGAGFYRSADGGESFTVLAAKQLAGLAFSELAVGADGRLWAGVARAGGTFAGFEGARNHPRRQAPTGLFRSTNGGRTWTRIGNGLPPLPVADVDIDPADPQRLFVTASDVFGDPRNGIYLSTDGGGRFREVLGVAGGELGRISLAIAPSDPSYVYAIASRPASRETTGGFTPVGDVTLALFASTDGGSSWTATYPGDVLGDQGVYDIAIAVSPQDPRVVFVAGLQMVRSSDGGATFANVTPPHVDIHDIELDASGRLLASGDGGVFRSHDLGGSWETLNNGLGTVQYYAGLASSPLDPELVVVGSQDNGTHVRRGRLGGGWDQVFGGDGGWSAVREDDPDTFVVQYQGAGNVFLTRDGGLSFNRVGGIDRAERTAFQGPLLLVPGASGGEVLYYATQRLHASERLAPFTPLSEDLTGGAPWAIRSLASSAADPAVLWATTSDGRVLVSSDRGLGWTPVRSGIAGWPRIMRQVAADPDDPSVAVVVDGGFGGARVLLTRNLGRTWTEIGRRLPDLPIFAVAIERLGGERQVFVGTDRGVFATASDGKRWTPYGSGLPNAPVHDLVVDAVHGRVVAATLGRGVWTTPLVAVGGR